MRKNVLLLLLIFGLVVFTFFIFYFSFIKGQREPQLPPVDEEIPVHTVTFSHFEIYVAETQNVEQDEPKPEKQPKSLGEFILTAYCPCTKCCGKWGQNRPLDEDGKPIVIGSVGTRLKEGRSIAVDPTVIPYGTEVIIDGVTYVAEDCGGAIKGNRIDVYFESHESALEFGRQTKSVYVEE